MLYPDFDELLALRHRAGSMGFPQRRNVASVLAGNYGSTFRGQGMEFEEVREYVPGDEVRNIDWRVTARTGTPHLKVFREERERSVILCVDMGSHMQFGTKGTFKSVQAARAASLLGWTAHRHQDRVGAMVFGGIKGGTRYFAPKRGRQSLWQLFGVLSGRDSDLEAKEVPLSDALQQLSRVAMTSALVFIIADFNHMTEATTRHLRNLHRRCEVVLLPVSDPADQKIAEIGMMTFEGQGRRVEINTKHAVGAKQYQQQWEENQQQLKDMVYSMHMRMIPLYTDQDVYDSLLKGLRHIEGVI